MGPYWNILAGLPTTVALSALALAIGAVAGVPLMLARRSSLFLLRAPARAVIDLFRAIPPIVWLFIIFFGLAETGLQLTPFNAAVAGLGVISAAYLAEVYRGGLMAIDKGQWEAGHALGLSQFHTFQYVLAPQAFRVALPSMATFAIALLKDTSLAYSIGVNEVLFRANSEAQIGSGSSLAILAFAGGLYALLSIPTALVARRLDTALRDKVAR
ncbi:MAG: amino acid ABC transporter permease [Gemmatimonadota bacterium]|nr:amino acid ABC transporter permease [Gemmatimonadota bacterium]